jgi:hypothetical protein
MRGANPCLPNKQKTKDKRQKQHIKSVGGTVIGSPFCCLKLNIRLRYNKPAKTGYKPYK